jgi:hypothetical protein
MKTELIYFCIAFTIGVLVVYLTSPTMKIIMKFPNPSNNKNLLYVDNNDVCYKYKSEKTECLLDSSNMNIIKY